MFSDFELMLGLAWHLGAFAVSPAKAAFAQLESGAYGEQAYPLAARVQTRPGSVGRSVDTEIRIYAHPTGEWVTQQARNLTMVLGERATSVKVLIRDRDAKYMPSFDAAFAADGVRAVTTPARAPRANAYAERWVRSVRAECLDWILIWNRRHLERVLSAYVAHYNLARPHRSIGLEVPVAPEKLPPPTGPIERLDVLSGLIHEYHSAA